MLLYGHLFLHDLIFTNFTNEHAFVKIQSVIRNIWFNTYCNLFV